MSAPQKSARELVLEQLHGHKTHELIPKSGKVVVFDVDLSLRHALDALAEHRLTHAPLWDSSRQEFLTVLVSDDIASLLSSFGRDAAQSAAAGHPGAQPQRSLDELALREVLGSVRAPDAVRTFSSLVPDDSLFAALQHMLQNRMRYLPLVDTEGSEPATILHVLTPLRVLHAIVHSPLFRSDPRMFSEPLSTLNLCTLLPSPAAASSVIGAAAVAAGLGEGSAEWSAAAHGGVQRNAVCCAALAHSPVWHALQLMAHHAVCALPVVSETGKLVDFIAPERVLAFARAMPHADLCAPISAALSTPLLDGLPAVRAADSLHAVLSAFSTHRLERLAVTADSGELLGAVTVLDVLAYFASSTAGPAP